jgi:hypothetical protein
MIISIDEQRVASEHARDECKRIHTSLLSASIASWSSIMVGQAAGQSRKLTRARGRVQPRRNGHTIGDQVTEPR